MQFIELMKEYFRDHWDCKVYCNTVNKCTLIEYFLKMINVICSIETLFRAIFRNILGRHRSLTCFFSFFLAYTMVDCWEEKWTLRSQICNLDPVQDGGGGGQKGPPTSFSSVTSTNVGISPQNILTFSFNPFHTLV